MDSAVRESAGRLWKRCAARFYTPLNKGDIWLWICERTEGIHNLWKRMDVDRQCVVDKDGGSDVWMTVASVA